MIRIAFILFFFAKVVPYTIVEYFPKLEYESTLLYWVLYSLLIFSFINYAYKNEDKSVINLLFTSFIFGALIVDILVFSSAIFVDVSYPISWKYGGYIGVGLLLYILLARRRYDWRMLESDVYNPRKVQAIYSKPNSFITLLGSATSLSPKCSVRYTYNDKTIRFKRGVKSPVLCNTVISNTDLIEDTNFSNDYFSDRWEEIKDKKFNLIKFNCRMLFKNK